MFDSSRHLIEEELETHGTYASVTKGVSMRPLFKTDRDMVIISPPKGELRKYDVALYRDGTGKYILHRVIRVEKDHYIIRGDNTYVREVVAKSRVIGVLTEFNRKGKHHTVNDFSYRFYARFWNFIYPLRACAYFTLRFAKRTVKRILGRK